MHRYLVLLFIFVGFGCGKTDETSPITTQSASVSQYCDEGLRYRSDARRILYENGLSGWTFQDLAWSVRNSCQRDAFACLASQSVRRSTPYRYALQIRHPGSVTAFCGVAQSAQHDDGRFEAACH